MARIGVAIVKRMAFRLSTQTFQNVYYFEAPLPNVVGDGDSLINQVWETEKKLHSTAVSFVFARAWTADGTPTQNVMLQQKALTGTGTFATEAKMDRERAYLVQWPAGLDIRGKPVKLKKWYHSCGPPLGVTLTDGKLAQTEALTDTDRSTIAAIADEVREVTTPSQTYNLCAKSGRNVEGACITHRFLEHHQLGDEWRG